MERLLVVLGRGEDNTMMGENVESTPARGALPFVSGRRTRSGGGICTVAGRRIGAPAIGAGGRTLGHVPRGVL
jgi:hypothetical protein